MSSRYPGGLITAADNTPSSTASTGVWKLEEAALFTNQDKWQQPLGDVGFWAGGEDASGYSATIDRVQIATTGNAIDFGDLSTAGDGASTSNTTRALVLSGQNASPFNQIQYYNMSNVGTQGDFGDLTVGRYFNQSAGASTTRAIFSAGRDSSSVLNVIDYVTIASTGDATDFGDLTVNRNQAAGGSNSTRSITSGGQNTLGNRTDVIDYVTIASTGNATDFGNLSVFRQGVGDAANSTRLVLAGGLGGSSGGTAKQNVLDYVTIASTGNATDFGDLTRKSQYTGGVSNATRGVFAGGIGSTSDDYGTTHLNIIDYITIGSTGNATDFGDLQAAKKQCIGATSNAHGGLQ